LGVLPDARPDLAAGLLLLDGTVLLPASERERLTGLWGQVLETDGWREALLGFFGGIAGESAERVRADIAAAPRVYAAPLLRDVMSSDYSSDLTEAPCPLLYVHGQMPMELDRLRALRPDAFVESIPNAEHWLMLTAPDEVNAVLDRFLYTVPSSTLEHVWA
jgi:pimeloyl-ACP methyl ester carboxylesterase